MKTVKLSLPILFLLFSCITNAANADSVASTETVPLSFKLNLITNGLNVDLNWDSVNDVKGYKLYYAPSPYTGPESINSIALGNINFISFDLWDGAAFYIAMSAYNAVSEIGFSNIKFFTLNQENESAISIFAIDGLSFEKIILEGEQSDYRPSYLLEALNSTGEIGMNLAVNDIYSFGFNCYESRCEPNSGWSGDANYSENYIGDLIEQTKYRYDLAKAENKKFILVSHSWGTVLAAIALGYLQSEYDVVPDLFITLSSPLGSSNNIENMDKRFWSSDTNLSLFVTLGGFVNPTQTVEDLQNFISYYVVKKYLDIVTTLNSEMPDLSFVFPKSKRWINYWAMGDIISGPLNSANGLIWCPTESGDSCVEDNRIDPTGTSRTFENTKLWHAITSLNENNWDEFLPESSIFEYADKEKALEFRNQVADDILSITNQ